MTENFLFLDDLMSVVNQQDAVITILDSFYSTETLLKEFSRQGKFPDYFGGNWDALSDCLRDLAWMKQRRLVVVHKGLPLSLYEDELRTYLKVLQRAVLDWKSHEDHEVVAVFPYAMRNRVTTLLKE